MRLLLTTTVTAMVTFLPLSAQPGTGNCCMGRGSQANGVAPIATNPVVDLKGVIRQVHISQGQGMPYLDVLQGSETVKVQLGSMRYLISENFNPKAGQEVTVRGYKTNGSVVAIEVNLPSEKKTLRLRDEKGWPLWRGGPMRFGRQRAGTQ
jgi:hypothetical protein